MLTEILFYGGIAGMILGALGFAASLLLFRIRELSLERIFDQEYGSDNAKEA